MKNKAKNLNQLDNKKLVKILREANYQITNAKYQIENLLNEHETPTIVEEIRGLISSGKLNKISASWLQKKYKMGYARAAMMLDVLEAASIIGPGEGAKPRKVL